MTVRRYLTMLLGFLVAADGFHQIEAAVTWFDFWGVPWAALDLMAGLVLLRIALNMPRRPVVLPTQRMPWGPGVSISFRK